MTYKKFGIDFIALQQVGYRNINELQKQQDQLHACETLFGDWNADVMILAQDAANYNTLKKMKDESHVNPFRHSPKNKTNQNLYKVMDSLKRFNLGTYEDPNNRNCNLYYANAIWLLKDSKDMSGAITNTKESYVKNGEVFKATLANLKNLKLIVTLGEHSFKFLQNFFHGQISSNWHETVTASKTHKVQHLDKSYLVGSIYHTSIRGMVARAKLNGYIGKNTCAKGIELSKNDLRILFTSIGM